MRLDQATVCIYDNGLFTSLAATLSQSFGRTLYFSNWVTSFPRSNSLLLGEGVANILRINSIWPHIDGIDLFVFPDIFDGPLQLYLRKLGKRVWGSGLAESLEFERAKSKKWLKQVGLPVGPYVVCKGVAELRRHLQRHDNVFVKISRSRGDMETFHARSYDLIEPRLNELEHVLGAKGQITEFIVEEPIECKAEVGYDGFCIDGQYPRKALFGVESKDKGYVGCVMPYASLPRPLQFVNGKLAPLYRDLKYRGFWSSEVRIAEDGTPYLIDPCCRMASPPGELYQYLIENLAEVLWHGAEGELVEPKWRHPWGAQLILTSDWAEHGWQPIEFPDDAEFHVKLHYHTVIGGKHYYVPQAVTMPEIGAVVAGGDTKEAAIKAVTRIAETVSGYDVKWDAAALEEASEGMEKLARAA